MKYRYGNAWEEFSIEQGEIWGLMNSSKVAVHNIFDPLPSFMFDADLLFVDPPWNKGNLTCFYTKAQMTEYVDDFSDFERILFKRIEQIDPLICYLEVGKQAVDKWQSELSKLYPAVQRWETTYYKKNLCYVLRGASEPTKKDYTGVDEKDVIFDVGASESYSVFGDLCMGQGLVGLSAYQAGKPFVGTELNKRRIAVLLQKLARKGEVIRKYET